MKSKAREPAMLFRWWMWLLAALLLAVLAVAISYAAQQVGPLPAPPRPPVGGQTAAPPTGRRWFWQRGQWQGPQTMQP